jgi:predicted TIM-barrel fold metal-dependent hydrolase
MTEDIPHPVGVEPPHKLFNANKASIIRQLLHCGMPRLDTEDVDPVKNKDTNLTKEQALFWRLSGTGTHFVEIGNLTEAIEKR